MFILTLSERQCYRIIYSSGAESSEPQQPAALWQTWGDRQDKRNMRNGNVERQNGCARATHTHTLDHYISHDTEANCSNCKRINLHEKWDGNRDIVAGCRCQQTVALFIGQFTQKSMFVKINSAASKCNRNHWCYEELPSMTTGAVCVCARGRIVDAFHSLEIPHGHGECWEVYLN